MTLTHQALEQLRFTNLGRLLDEVHLGFDHAALAYLRARGYPWLNPAHSHVMRTMQLEGASISAMAAQARISKQAMSKLVMQFRAKGLLRVEDDPADGRNRIAVVTDAGCELLVHGVEALRQAEDDLAALIGRTEMESLRRILRLVRDKSSTMERQIESARRRRR